MTSPHITSAQLGACASEVRAFVGAKLETARAQNFRIIAPDNITLVGEDWMARNSSLREQLAAEWAISDIEKRTARARWYIYNWGGIHGNDEAKYRLYAEAEEEALATFGFQGIASWSKVLAMRNPTAFAIYDARVAFALNAIQVVSTGGIALEFAVPPTQNKALEEPLTRLRQYRLPTTAKVPRRSSYKSYIDVLKATGDRPIEVSEMVLFAMAPDLAGRI